MKRFALILLTIVLSGCSKPINDVADQQVQKSDQALKPIVVSVGSDNMSGYVVGGIVDGELINYQDEDNYKLFQLTGEESYTLLSADGETTVAKSTGVQTNFVSAVGLYETTVTLDKTFESSGKFVGVGSEIDNTTPISCNDSFESDFDKDGKTERISVEKSEDNVVIALENQNGETVLAEFIVDGTYTNDYAMFTLDVDDDGKQEFILCQYGHNYSTEIFDITSENQDKIIEYYMGN